MRLGQRGHYIVRAGGRSTGEHPHPADAIAGLPWFFSAAEEHP